MKLTYFCPECWNEVDVEVAVCPHCHYGLRAYEQLPFEQKLLRAVRHPVQDNRLLAIQMLGRLRSRAAVQLFATALESEDNFFIIREVARALAQIGNAPGHELLERIALNPLPMVKQVAQELLAQSTFVQDYEGDTQP